MPRNIVICCDGTSNQFGPTVTNVFRLVRVLESDGTTQIVHYAPGVGTMPEPGFVTPLMQKWSILTGLAFGAGLSQAVEDLYCYLMEVWEPGDKVYLFGFSRGAYTVRVLAAMLHLFGLLPKNDENHVPYAMRLFRSVRSYKGSTGSAKYFQLCDEFRSTFARPMPPLNGRDERHFPVEFIGVWDTVSSVGWVWEPAIFPFTATNPSIKTVRHAISIDERRCFFRQNRFMPPPGQDVKEHWFAGSHGDVGGGYDENAGLVWVNGLNWMINEATNAGLKTNSARLKEHQAIVPAEPWKEPIHDSLKSMWWLLEFIPKWHYSFETKSSSFYMGLGRRRTIQCQSPKNPGAIIDRSALLRIRDLPYDPSNLSPAFLAKVRKLKDIPDGLEVTE